MLNRVESTHLFCLFARTTTDMNIQNIAEKAFNKLEPSHTRRMETYAGSTNPEIINGKKVLDDRKTRMVGIIADAITEAVADRQRALDAVWATWTQGAELSTAVEMVRPLVSRQNEKSEQPERSAPDA